jgi:hypothetical protein
MQRGRSKSSGPISTTWTATTTASAANSSSAGRQVSAGLPVSADLGDRLDVELAGKTGGAMNRQRTPFL